MIPSFLRRVSSIQRFALQNWTRPLVTVTESKAMVSPIRTAAECRSRKWVSVHSSISCRHEHSRGMATAAGLVDVDGDRPALSISDRCAKRIIKVQKEGFLRLRVDGGGCSGFQYKFQPDSKMEGDDVVFEKDGAKLVIDETSLDLVRGSTVDFVEEMISSSFQVLNNPNSEGTCGCGSSFSPKN
ncbi:hypothetical protein GUITHDRAFT_152876 [Guillardia theta CCMP2712]|uniref:Core domain-containing protein n=1 Tax=Guillardia theta (strain CCMP2712) TaxID=905079 RepID=L1J8G5_GUITC|nr:hypothetical protein GUITHDRAFT_152876 [Guillardia theta CCMP2712]EKX44833.1 hypothetical protein GUITHDRAFT_152876 [Guillardia theta CCMP2712]|eukprot:XP_005831813.1 hypothetical protein GUITHDRAFT_152876 [Guillardia theta CCMP2712]